MKRQYDTYFIYKKYSTAQFLGEHIIWKLTFSHSGHCSSLVSTLDKLSVCLGSSHFAKQSLDKCQSYGLASLKMKNQESISIMPKKCIKPFKAVGGFRETHVLWFLGKASPGGGGCGWAQDGLLGAVMTHESSFVLPESYPMSEEYLQMCS